MRIWWFNFHAMLNAAFTIWRLVYAYAFSIRLYVSRWFWIILESVCCVLTICQWQCWWTPHLFRPSLLNLALWKRLCRPKASHISLSAACKYFCTSKTLFHAVKLLHNVATIFTLENFAGRSYRPHVILCVLDGCRYVRVMDSLVLLEV